MKKIFVEKSLRKYLRKKLAKNFAEKALRNEISRNYPERRKAHLKKAPEEEIRERNYQFA